ncbi:MAG: PaREP1 family protein [Desulfurococcaceae archaeon]
MPRPTAGEYASARVLESLVEGRLAVEFLERGLVRNAAGKAFQAWRALLAALLRLELDKLLKAAKTDEERKWLVERAVLTTRMKLLSQMLEGVGHVGIVAWTNTALLLHEYQYHGPDPDLAASMYRSKEEAARDVELLVSELARRADGLRQRVKWDAELEEALSALKEELSGGSV